MKLTSILFTAIISQLFLVNSATAHHGNVAHFDTAKSVEVEGVISSFAFTNPHVHVYFTVTDEQGQPHEWRCETASATGMRRVGWTEDTLRANQNIRIIGSPARREERFCSVKQMFVEGVEYDSDQRPPNSVQESILAFEPVLDQERPLYLENGQPNISGNWYNPHWGDNRLAPYPLNGGYVRTEAGQIATDNFNDLYESPALFCRAHNIIRAWVQNSHVNLVSQTDDAVHIINGYMDFERTIHLDQAEHPEVIEPSTAGHSIGWWEGDTLVVDTIGFSEGSIFPRNDVMHSDQMHVIERFRFNPETQFLERRYTVEDPLYLAEVRREIDYQAISPDPYVPFGCEVQSVENNTRPEDP